jgi:hypothetical protein
MFGMMRWLTMTHADCPEQEANYIITSGGINDVDKA